LRSALLIILFLNSISLILMPVSFFPKGCCFNADAYFFVPSSYFLMGNAYCLAPKGYFFSSKSHLSTKGIHYFL